MESDKNEIDLNVLNSIDVDSVSKNLKDQNEINFVDINGNIEDNIDNKENMVEDPVELEKNIHIVLFSYSIFLIPKGKRTKKSYINLKRITLNISI